MDSQSIAYLIVYAVIIGFGILLLVILRGVVQWWLGTSEIIRLLEEQNKLLSERTRNVSKPVISKTDVQFGQPQSQSGASGLPPAHRPTG